MKTYVPARLKVMRSEAETELEALNLLSLSRQDAKLDNEVALNPISRWRSWSMNLEARLIRLTTKSLTPRRSVIRVP